MARVAEAARFAKLLAMLAHEARLVRTFGDMHPTGDHDRDLPRQARSRGPVPDVRESSTALCVKRGGLQPPLPAYTWPLAEPGQQPSRRSPTASRSATQPQLRRSSTLPRVHEVKRTPLTRSAKRGTSGAATGGGGP